MKLRIFVCLIYIGYSSCHQMPNEASGIQNMANMPEQAITSPGANLRGWIELYNRQITKLERLSIDKSIEQWRKQGWQ